MTMPARLVVAILVILVFGCAPGKSRDKIPRHQEAGHKQIEDGLAWYKKGCYARALEDFFRAYELFSASDLLEGVAMSLNNIGTVYRETGEYEEAVLFFDEALSIYLQLDDRPGGVQVLSNKAAALIGAGKTDLAGEAIEEAARMASTEKNDRLLAAALQNKGVLLTRKGLHEEAEEVFSACLGYADKLDPSGRASLYYAYATLMRKTGRPAVAVSFFEKALLIDRERGFYKGIAEDLFSMGQAYSEMGRQQEAVQSWKRSAKIFAMIDRSQQVQETMAYLRDAASKGGIDIALTEAFVEQWRKGMLREHPCGD